VPAFTRPVPREIDLVTLRSDTSHIRSATTVARVRLCRLDWTTTATAIGVNEVITAVRSPWQDGDAERLIGSIRRECLDHVGNC